MTFTRRKLFALFGGATVAPIAARIPAPAIPESPSLRAMRTLMMTPPTGLDWLNLARKHQHLAFPPETWRTVNHGVSGPGYKGEGHDEYPDYMEMG